MLKWTQYLFSLSEADINFKSAFLFIFLFAACGEIEQIGNKLTDAEKDAIRLRAQTKCISENSPEFNNYKSTNLENLEDYVAGDHWPVTYSDDGATRNYTITVWKVDATSIYLRIFVDANPDLNNYVKLTFAQNSTMIDELLNAKCALTYGDADNVTMASSSATVIVDGDRLVSGNKQIENDFIYRFNSAFPAFIANYNNKQTTKTYDLDDRLESTDIFEFSIGSQTSVTLESSYKATTIPGTIQYCIPTTTDTVAYTLQCTQSDTVGPAGWANPSLDL